MEGEKYKNLNEIVTFAVVHTNTVIDMRCACGLA